MKLCSRCRELVGGSGFYPEKRAKDGLTSACKRCVGKSQRAYRATERGKAYQDKYQHAYRGSEHGKIVQRRLNLAYRTSEHGKVAIPAYKRAWLKTSKGRAFRERERKSLQGLARRTVQRARRRGKLIPGPCAVCGSTEGIEAHHHKGYAKEHWLDIQWLCYPCHQRTE